MICFFQQEWSNAILFSLFTPSLIIFLLNTLILEKSVVIYGSNISLVSALTSAVVQLLRPFPWEGVFIPLIPSDAIEILEAPVPFVVGTNIPFDVHKISPAANVLFVDEILRCYLKAERSADEMMNKKCLHRSLDETVKMPLNQNLRNQLSKLEDGNVHASANVNMAQHCVRILVISCLGQVQHKERSSSHIINV